MAKGDSSGPSGQPQAPKIDQYSVMHRLMDMGSPLAGSAMAPTGQTPQSMGGNIGSMPMQRDLMNQGSGTDQPSNGFNVGSIGQMLGQAGMQSGGQMGQIGQAPNSLVPENVQGMIRRRMTGMNSYGSQ